MKLGLELIAGRPASLRLGTFFEIWLATPEGMLRRSLGRDEYHLSLTIEDGRRLSATGRTHICQVDLEAAGLGTNQAREAALTEADLTAETPLIWGIRTNLFLDLSALTLLARGRLVREGTEPVEFSFHDPRVTAEQVAPGRYILDLTRLLAS